MSLSSPRIPKTSSSVTLLKPHVQNAGPHVSTSIWRKGLVVKNAHRLFPAWSEEDRKTLSIFKILLLSWLPYHTYPPRSLSPYLLHCFSVFVCFTLAQHDCDGKGNITLLIWPQATAYNCLSVPYGSSAFGTSMQIVFISNGAFPF